ncbi:hypothetical protein ACFWFR_00925 [Oerskovia sp. NPDC060287]|uniref:hypothetical protein n=1 Tax=Oerskovia sp. NPDC060287 TaxID=3347095 RepID=UPI003659E62B
MDAHTTLNARTDLLWIVDRWPRLQARLHGGGGNALTGMPSGSKEAPLPIDVGVSDLMREIEDQARFYAAVLLDEIPPEHGCDKRCVNGWIAVAAEATKTGRPVPPAPSSWDCPDRRDPITTSAMPALLAQVAVRFGHFTQDEREALDFCDEANDFRERVRKTLEQPAPPTYVGPCSSRGADGAGCGGELYLREGRERGTCRECGTEFTHDEQQAYISDALEERLMTPAEIVRALKIVGREVKAGTVFKWVQRGRLEEVVDGLYRLADALDLADRPRHKQVAA